MGSAEQGSVPRVALSAASSAVGGPLELGTTGEWRVSVSDALPLHLRMGFSSVDGELELGGLRLENLDLDLRVDAGIGTVDIQQY